MNEKNLELLFQNYVDNYAFLNDPQGGYETYKWHAVNQVQNSWDINAEDLSSMIKSAFSKTYNLINNRIVSPGNGLSLLAKEEPETVRASLKRLLVETDDVDLKQAQAQTFVDEMNGLLERYFPGKWKYTQDLRVAITYLSLINPNTNYLYKSSPAHYFAKYMEFPADLGYGADFKLQYYYQMCDELITAAMKHSELVLKTKEREKIWPDENHHLLATDLIYCFGVYKELRAGLYEPSRKIKSRTANEQDATIKAEQAEKLRGELEQIQNQIDSIEKTISEMPPLSMVGMVVKTKAFGTQTITKQNGQYIFLSAQGKEREFALPDCVTNRFVVPDNQAIIDRCHKESDLQKQINGLTQQQKNVTLELRRIE